MPSYEWLIVNCRQNMRLLSNHQMARVFITFFNGFYCLTSNKRSNRTKSYSIKTFRPSSNSHHQSIKNLLQKIIKKSLKIHYTIKYMPYIHAHVCLCTEKKHSVSIFWLSLFDHIEEISFEMSQIILFLFLCEIGPFNGNMNKYDTCDRIN